MSTEITDTIKNSNNNTENFKKEIYLYTGSRTRMASLQYRSLGKAL